MSSNRSSSLPQKEVRRITLIPSRQEPIDPEYKYLPPIQIQNQDHNDDKWAELKIDGRNINHRAYTAVAIHSDYLYLYGGYQVTSGIMSDFYRMNLKAAHYNWEPIKESPGPRSRHQMCTYCDRIYTFGGQVQQSVSTNQMNYYDTNLRQWVLLKPNQTYPPELDCYSATLYNKSWIIFGGFFGGSIGLHSNYVYQYDFPNNNWQRLQPKDAKAPAPRDGAAISIHSDSMYMFGGSNGSQRFNDLWLFNLTKLAWMYIPVKSTIIPRVRSGHIMGQLDNKLIVFGGIHDITWELDDLFVYDIKSMEWIGIDEDSSRRKETQILVSPPKDSGTQPTRFNFRKTTRNSSMKKRRTISPLRKQEQSEESMESPTRNMSNAYSSSKTMEEKRKKEQLQKKHAMLKLFEVNDVERTQFKIDSPVSEAMKNSLLMIGNPKANLKLRPGRLTEFGKPLISKFLQPLTSVQNAIQGKKPCARDGHACAQFGEQLLIVGGDRHQMSFNDIHTLDLRKV